MADVTPSTDVQTTDTPAAPTPSTETVDLARCPVCDRIHGIDESGPCPRCGYSA